MPYSYGVTARSHAAPDAVFAALVHATTWPRWSPIDSAEVEGDTRIFRTGRSVSRERIVELVEDRRFVYDNVGGPFRSYRGTVDLAPAPGGGTHITWSATFEPKTPLSGGLWRWYLTRFMQRMADGLAAYASGADVAARPPKTTSARTLRDRKWWVLWGLMALAAVGMAVGSVPPYLSGDASDAPLPLNPDVAPHYLSLMVHALPGGLALALGPLQFVRRLRVSRPRLHRVIGRVYMISVVVASIAAAVNAAVTISGFAVQVAFFILVAAWLYTVAMAYRAIRRGQVQLHRIWMIRNYTLTFAAVTLRVYLLLGLQLAPSTGFEAIYTAAVWASILGNVLVAEYFIVQRMLVPLAARQQRRDADLVATSV